jgi:glycerophosphoryl diester phosphodiesterase
VNTGSGLHGNTLLADVIDAAAGNIIKRFAEKVFDGTEDWKQYPGLVGVYYLDGITPEATALTAEYAEMAICTHFGQTTKDLTGAENALRFQKVTKSSRVYISCNQFVTVAELKAFLVNQHTNGTPVTMVYPRYSEEKIALTEAEIEEYRAFNSYHPYTKVSVDDGVLDVTYTINSVQHFERKNHKSTENYGITENYGKNCVRTIAHRGDVQTAPENTIAAYRQAIRNGYKYMETDVRFTGDGVPVMLHDATIDRTSNGKGSVSIFTLEELKQFDFGGWKSEEYAGEKIPTFAEMLAFCRATGMVPFIELKGQTKTQVETLVDLVDKYGLLNDVHWISFSEQCLEYVRTAHTDANLCYINSEVTAENAAMVAGWKTGKNEVGILPYRNATENAAKICRGAGLYMMAGTITNPTQVSNAPIYTSWFIADGVNATELLYRSAMGD